VSRILLFLFATLAVCAQPEPQTAPERTVILHTNDLHGQVYPLRGKGGLAALSSLIKRIRAEEEARGSAVLVVDCGDFYQGTPEGDLPKGRLVVEIMNEIGYDAACLGNHEFDKGQAQIRDLASIAKFPFLAANLLEEETGRRPDYARDSVTVTGVRLVGVITPELTSLVSAEAHAGLSVEDPLETLRRYPDSVVLSHCGEELERRFPGRFVIGGHSHKSIKLDGRYQQAGSRAQWLGKVVLGPEPEAELLKVEAEEDPAVVALIARYAPEIDRIMNEEVGELRHDMVRKGAGTSSPLGNYLCDLMRDAAGAAIAFHNRTGIRTDMKAGLVRRRDVYEVSPFGNTVVAMDLSGAQVLELLEHSVAEERFLLEVSGLEFEYDARGPPGKRVLRAAAGGQDLQPSKTYRVATNSFLAGGGDKHSAFSAGTDRADTFLDLMELHIRHLRAHRPLTYEFQPRIHPAP